ncbi:acetoin utilization protein AcuC [Paenisporosarcina cavernae]|uniref:Acetoin utilization protein AcuC n=1 Tax=Paenisporosarcina cavernae TaxID=2320858 RepID=A0A385YU88_9BACL|nr:acetoin utilization protein AcuC [Paenisporosarcina cavernae]AYC29870.1 acetoin utilization protein AcuC [Paenisporosarcina cavernae]
MAQYAGNERIKSQAVYIYSEELLTYKFAEDHPFNQKRLEMTTDLLKKMNALSDDQILAPRKATDEELLLFHDPSYVTAVKNASKGIPIKNAAESFGIGTEDTPIFSGMHDASALLVGGTLTAVDAVMSGKSRYALHLGGGLHHGFKGRASGFCVYNDSAVAIKYIQQKYGAKVLYIDTDAHHGDGVQWAFYEDPSVCTISIHETGRYLFPGTGNITERGSGEGYGTTFNFPIDAFTEDESFLTIYRSALTEIAEFFQPDVILTQNGADAHYYDPLTHLYGSIDIYKEIPKLAKEMAEKYCDGKWIAVGGGGYDIWRVVPRAWSLIWMEMNNLPQPEGSLPNAWINAWEQYSPVPIAKRWDDSADMYEPIPRKQEITEKNEQMLQKALYPIRSEK